jgi:hypothetical protein
MVSGWDDSTTNDLLRDRPLWNNGYDAPGGARGKKVEEAELEALGFLPRRTPINSQWLHVLTQAGLTSWLRSSGTFKKATVDNMLYRKTWITTPYTGLPVNGAHTSSGTAT